MYTYVTGIRKEKETQLESGGHERDWREGTWIILEGKSDMILFQLNHI